MLEQIWAILEPKVIEILIMIFGVVVSAIGTKIKKIYKEKVNDETKRKVVKTVVNAVEQLYKGKLSGEEKLKKAQEGIIDMLNEKGISITELEMNMFIEEVCNSFNQAIKEV